MPYRVFISYKNALAQQLKTLIGFKEKPEHVKNTKPENAKDRQPKPEKKPASGTASVKRTPIIVTVAVVLVSAIVCGIWAISANTRMPFSLLLSVSVGDHFTFGRYPQGEHGKVMPIEWRVLDVKDGKALVISEKLLDCKQYHTGDDKYVTWESCTLRKWLNDDFLNEAFHSGELAKIATVTNQNPDNPETSKDSGNATEDILFALSIKETEKYFRNNEDRMAAPTEYAKKNGVWISDYDSLSNGEKAGCWWLRSPGNFSYIATVVNYNGFIYQCGNYVYSIDVAVRPAMWIKISK